jgi:tRNA pseudouridine38-40 synthase
MTEATRYRAVLAYVGTAFHGWQIQKNAPRTVQAALEDALERFAGAPVRALAAGRTDAGVHAEGQVVHFDLPVERGDEETRDGVNALLPWDVRVLEARRAPPDFDARRDARWKEYLYRWSRAPVIAPRDSPFTASISAGADPARMREGARRLEGTRDFGVFAVRRPARGSSVRTLFCVSIREEGAGIEALFRGDGFLRGMVRSLCGLLAEVSRGRFAPERVEELLATGDRRLLAPKAPAKGLTLLRVGYGEEVCGPRSPVLGPVN